MKKWILNLSFQRKLLLSFVILSCIPILLLGITTYRLYTHFIINMTERSSIDTINLVCNDIDSLLKDTWNLCDMLTDDIKIQKYLRIDFPSISSQYSNDLTGSMELASISTYRKDIFGVYVLGENGGRYKSNYYSFKPDDFRQSSWYNQIITAPHPIWFPPHEGSFIVRSSIEDRFITVGLPVTNKATGQINGIVAADIREDTITERIRNSLSNGIIYIIDPQGNILFQSHMENNFRFPIELSPQLTKQIIDVTAKSPNESVVVSDKDYLVVSRVLESSGWRIAGVMNRDFLAQDNRNITKIVTLLLLFIAFSALYVSMLISQTVYKPIQMLCDAMEAVENSDFSVRFSLPYNDELGRLGQSFNHMLSKIQQLIDQIYTEQKKLRTSELRALQAQIQPHFLYNSLDSIIWLLRMKKNEDAEKMLIELSSLFKIALSKGNEVISIQDEVKHISSYLFISNMIYSKKFTYSIECDPSLYEYKTLKLLLQPLAENAILHAVPLPNERVHIHVSIFEKKSCLVLSVQDISTGIPPAKLKQLNELLLSSQQPGNQTSGYGLYNVNERIHILFGENFGLSIHSEENFGTEIIIKIPKIKRGDYFVSGNSM